MILELGGGSIRIRNEDEPSACILSAPPSAVQHFLNCGRNLCFFSEPNFQDPTQRPSCQTPSAKFLLRLQLTHKNMDTKETKKKWIRKWKLSYWFRSNIDEWILPNKKLLYHFYICPFSSWVDFHVNFCDLQKNLKQGVWQDGSWVGS